MKDYIAKSKDGKDGAFLTVDTQMEKYLAAGWSIYERDRDNPEKEIVIATPEDGFLDERPSFPVENTMTIRTNSEMEQVARILLGMEA